jgi:hypothetical protein
MVVVVSMVVVVVVCMFMVVRMGMVMLLLQGDLDLFLAAAFTATISRLAGLGDMGIGDKG